LETLTNVSTEITNSVLQIQTIQQNWKYVSDNLSLFDEGTDYVTVSNIFRSNMLLANESLVQLYQLAVASEEYVNSKSFYENGTLANFNLTNTYFQRINTLADNILDLLEYVSDLIVGKSLFDQPGLNDDNLVMEQIQISTQIDPIDNIVYNIQQDFEKTFTRMTIQITGERQNSEQLLTASQARLKEYTDIKGYVQKQIQIDTIYA